MTAANYSGVVVNTLDLCPNFAGVLMAITNGMGGIISVMVPSMVASIVVDVSFLKIEFYVKKKIGLFKTSLCQLLGFINQY